MGTATRWCTRRRRWERRRGGGLGEQCVAQGASLDRGGGAWMVGRLGKQAARELDATAGYGSAAAPASALRGCSCVHTWRGRVLARVPRRWGNALRAKAVE
jgi:hypothetical protein